MWQNYYQPNSLAETLQLLRLHVGSARIIAGGTDVMVELQRGVKPTQTLIDITRIDELHGIARQGDTLHLGALATHNDVIASVDCVQYALPLAQACWEVGAPQIRTRGTVAGNLVTASPANDTIPPLLALGAEVVIVNVDGERIVPLADFYPGFRKTVLQPDELIRQIRVPILQANQRGLYLKLGLRRAQAISVIDLAFVLTFDRDPATDSADAIIQEARITLGCLAPTIVRSPSAEGYLVGKRLTPEVCAEAGRLACQDVKPIGDVRGSAEYRLATLETLVMHGLQRIAAGQEREGWPARAVLLETKRQGDRERGRRGDGETRRQGDKETGRGSFAGIVETVVNGCPVQLVNAARQSLLDALREEAGLTGSKEGCAEGECGACTLWLNGQAVMSCLTPAAQAHNGLITTIEGLASKEALHPLQQAFIDHAAVQCGYCIPGMIMAGAKLLEEQPQPTLDQIQVALSGNLCRCTGYRKIIDAVQAVGGVR